MFTGKGLPGLLENFCLLLPRSRSKPIDKSVCPKLEFNSLYVKDSICG